MRLRCMHRKATGIIPQQSICSGMAVAKKTVKRALLSVLLLFNLVVIETSASNTASASAIRDEVMANQSTVYSINLPAQTVADSLASLSEQLDILLLFPYQIASNLQANPVKGKYTLSQTLELVLQDTGFSGRLTPKGVLMISLTESYDAIKKGRVKESTDMNVNHKTKRNILASTIAVFVAGGVSAQNQVDESAAAHSGIDEIIVTAQKREQKLMDVPISISAIGEDALKDAGIQSMNDLSYLVPSLTVTEQDGGTQFISIRGVGNGLGTSPLTGIYLDEIPLSVNALLKLDVQAIDLQRVEVLRGPQGTLYGQGAVGGTIRFITNKPSFDGVEGEVGVSLYDTDRGGLSEEVTAIANMPVIDDTLAFRVAVAYKDKSGWIDQPDRDDTNDNELLNLHLKGLWQVSDKFTVDAAAIQYRSDSGGVNQVNGQRTGGDVTDSTFQPIVRDGLDFPLTDINYDYDIYNLTLSYDLGFATLLSASSHYDVEYNIDSSSSAILFDSDAVGLPPTTPGTPGTLLDAVLFDLTRSTEAFTQEVRLVGNSERLDWIVGAFYSDVETENSISDFQRYLSGTLLLSGITSDDTSTSKSAAIFANLSYQINDQLTLAGGTRYFEDERTSINPTVNPPQSDKGDFDKLSSKISLAYTPTDQATFYISASEGFRSGGFNAHAMESYKPETLLSYELGTKAVLLNGRLSAEAAIFHSEYTDYQGTTVNADGLGVTGNPGEAEIQGVEWATRLQITEQFSVGFSGHLQEAEFVEVDELDPTYNVGDPLFLVPKFSYSLIADYTFNWSSSISGFAHLDYNRQGGNSWINRTPVFVRQVGESSDIGFLNAQIGAQWNAITVRLFGKNLNNEHRPTAGSLNSLHTQQRPRTIGIDINYQF